VVDEFLRRHGFSHPRTTDHAPEAALSPLRPRAVQSPSLLHHLATPIQTGESRMISPTKTPLAGLRGALPTGDTPRRLLPFSAPSKRLQSEIGSDSPAGSLRKRHKWIDDMLAVGLVLQCRRAYSCIGYQPERLLPHSESTRHCS
jgi:hypothetical protein